MKSIILLFIFMFTMQSFAQLEDGGFQHEGTDRTYKVFLPQNYNGIDKFPVVINLHGDTRNAQWTIDYMDMNALADTAGFIVVYPNATGISFNYDTNPSVAPKKPDFDNITFINALLDTLNNDYSIDLERVYAAGWSGGGIMSYKLACFLGYRFAGVANVSGLLSIQNANNRVYYHKIPVMIMHGTDDVNVWYVGGDGWQPVEDTFDYWGDINSCSQIDTTILPDINTSDGSTVVKYMYSNCQDNRNVVLYKIINGGHNWPGATRDLTEWWAGNTNHDINASKEIWDFFKEHSNSKAYIAAGKSLWVEQRYIERENEPLLINARVDNREDHETKVFALFKGETSGSLDSTELFDDGLNNDGQAGDGIWGKESWISDFTEDHFKVNLITHDLEENTRHSLLWEPQRFTTKGPITVVHFDTVGYDSRFNAQRINLIIQNLGLSATIENIWVKISTSDQRIDHVSTLIAPFPDLAAGAIDTSATSYVINFASDSHPDSTEGDPIKFNAEIYSNNRLFWTDSFDIEIITDISSKHSPRSPKQFTLEQNYPNPFNPLTKITYQLPKTDKVNLTVFNTSGREIQTLVNERQPAGQHKVTFNAENLSSGIYYYQLTTKTGYSEARKMVVLK